MEEKESMMEKNFNLLVNTQSSISMNTNDIARLSAFTSLSKLDIMFSNLSLSSFFILHIIKSKKMYALVKNKKKYHFQRLSDVINYSVDKKILLNFKKRHSEVMMRTLRLACSPDLLNACLIAAVTNNDLSLLIEYEKNHHSYIIDYANNLVMAKENYQELYQMKEVSRIDQATLYKIHYLFTKGYAEILNPFYVLLFPNEILKDISKIEKWVVNKFARLGIHSNNYFWLGDNCDGLFLMDEDIQAEKISSIYHEIREFTMNPNLPNNHITFDEKNKKYIYHKRNENVTFELLSDSIENPEIKEELLSSNRYGACHENSTHLMFGFDTFSKKWLINGQIKINEKDYYYHTWVEFEKQGEILVIDYNSNIILRKEDYDRLTGAREINRTDIDTLETLIHLLDDFDLHFHPMIFGYFSQELKRDLEKNKFLMKQKETE